MGRRLTPRTQPPSRGYLSCQQGPAGWGLVLRPSAIHPAYTACRAGRKVSSRCALGWHVGTLVSRGRTWPPRGNMTTPWRLANGAHVALAHVAAIDDVQSGLRLITIHTHCVLWHRKHLHAAIHYKEKTHSDRIQTFWPSWLHTVRVRVGVILTAQSVRSLGYMLFQPIPL